MAKAPSRWRTTLRRWLKFNAVGIVGVAVQAGALTLLVNASPLHYLLATAIAVEAAVLHNFCWHWKWTWADRPGVAHGGVWGRLLRFHLTNGLFSMAGNLVFMRLLVGTVRLDPLVANLVSIALCSLINFLLADRIVFTAPRPKRAIQTVLC